VDCARIFLNPAESKNDGCEKPCRFNGNKIQNHAGPGKRANFNGVYDTRTGGGSIAGKKACEKASGEAERQLADHSKGCRPTANTVY